MISLSGDIGLLSVPSEGLGEPVTFIAVSFTKHTPRPRRLALIFPSSVFSFYLHLYHIHPVLSLVNYVPHRLEVPRGQMLYTCSTSMMPLHSQCPN